MIIRTSNLGVIQGIKQQVYIQNPDGSTYLDPFVFCMSIDANNGSGNSSATFELPTVRWDEYSNLYLQSGIFVYAGSSWDNMEQVFYGYIGNEASGISVSDDKYSFSALCPIKELDKIFVGYADKVPTVKYQRYDVFTDTLKKQTPKDILEDLFDNLPSNWKLVFGLGKTDCLKNTYENSNTDITFSGQTYQQALDTIIGNFGDVNYRVRYNGFSTPKVLIDFYKVNDSSNTTQFVQMPLEGQDVLTTGANVIELTQQNSTMDSINRIIGFGKQQEIIVAIPSKIEEGSTAEPLIKGWANPSVTWSYENENHVMISGTHTAEEWVCLDPEHSNPKSKLFIAQCELVYKRWFLSTCVWDIDKSTNLEIEQDLPPDIQATGTINNSKTSAQAVKRFVKHIRNPQNDEEIIATYPENQYEKIDGCKFQLKNNYIDFQKPVLDVTSVTINPNTDKEIKTYAPCLFWVNITLLYDYLKYDTGQPHNSDIGFPTIGTDGQIEILQRDEFRYKQFNLAGTDTHNNKAYTLKDFEDNPVTYESIIYYNESSKTWVTVVGQEVIQDDYKPLKKLCEEILKQKNKRHKSYDITLAYFSPQYKVGDKLVILGQSNWDGDNYCISNISHDLINHSTKLTIDNVRPPNRMLITSLSKQLKQGGEE